MEKQIELLLQVFKNNDATLNETKEALLNLLVVVRQSEQLKDKNTRPIRPDTGSKIDGLC